MLYANHIAEIISNIFELVTPVSPLAVRLELLRDFTSILKKYRVDISKIDDSFERLWYNIRDLFDRSKNTEAKTLGIHVVCSILSLCEANVYTNDIALLKGLKMIIVINYEIDIFNIIREVDDIDCSAKVKAMRIITNNGKQIIYFTPQIVLDTIIFTAHSSKSASAYQTCLSFISDIIRSSFSCLDENAIVTIIDFSSRILSSKATSPLLFDAINIYELIVSCCKFVLLIE
jgi:hypothetical protein